MQSSDVIQLAMVVLTIGSVGCDVTRELLTAPFDATTVVSGGTTQATGEITQPSKEFASTTTLGPLYRNELMLRAVITYNFDNLQHNSAQDRGEYLTSMVTLEDVPLAHQGLLFAELQQRYTLLYPQESAPGESLQHLMGTVASLRPTSSLDRQ